MGSQKNLGVTRACWDRLEKLLDLSNSLSSARHKFTHTTGGFVFSVYIVFVCI